jgi:hypothetical protein
LRTNELGEIVGLDNNEHHNGEFLSDKGVNSSVLRDGVGEVLNEAL